MALDLPQRELPLMIGPSTIVPMQEHEEPQPEWLQETTPMHDKLGHDGQRVQSRSRPAVEDGERGAMGPSSLDGSSLLSESRLAEQPTEPRGSLTAQLYDMESPRMQMRQEVSRPSPMDMETERVEVEVLGLDREGLTEDMQTQRVETQMEHDALREVVSDLHTFVEGREVQTLEEAEAVLRIQEREASDWRAQVQRILREYEPPADATNRDRLVRRVVFETVQSSQLESQVSTLVRLRRETEQQTHRLFYEDAATAGWQEEVRRRRRTGEDPMSEGERTQAEEGLQARLLCGASVRELAGMMEHVRRVTQTEVKRGEVLQDAVQRIGALERENRGLRGTVRDLVTSAERARQSTLRLEQRITPRGELEASGHGRSVRLDIPQRDSQTEEPLGAIRMTCEEAAVVDKLMLEPDEIKRRREAEARGLDWVPPSELAVQGGVWREMGGRHDEQERISEPRDVMPQQNTSESVTLLPMTLPFTPAPALGPMDNIVHLLSSESERCDEEATAKRAPRMLSPDTVGRVVQDVTIRLERARPQTLPVSKKAKIEDSSTDDLCSWCDRGGHDRVACPAFQDDLRRRVVQFDGQGRVRDMRGTLLPRRRHGARRAVYDRLSIELRDNE
ncbi:hypothetical protein CBR_g41143 [Chara braunii]|uniref:Uncharacterized protein n=1 Tax=Chara braunii TaxID=69332 RepID=A0A388LVG4_CHABU|nr:hypothetical protein CBR_g41143 [Chara braunii]|eukprot:GBG86239.1 hypothetical protein CBR_g41143 [Chara braunii]